MAKRLPPFVPLFVADRPMSLQIIKGLPLQEYPGVLIGIMAHANTTDNFQKALAEYPCDNLACCAANNNHPCPFQTQAQRRSCAKRIYILNHTIKMCDSGMFTKEGATLTYEELFKSYERMGVEFGVMIDVFRDSEETIKSAKEALEAYKPHERKRNRFELVVVAQGHDTDEYIHCYKELRKLGFKHIAVGGLLHRREDAVRLAVVRDQNMLFETLTRLREEFPDDWLFALGCLHPNRLPKFQELKVWADYKGWIFQYDKKDVILNQYYLSFETEYLSSLKGRKYASSKNQIKTLLINRKNLVERLSDLTQIIYKERRELRAELALLHRTLEASKSEIAEYVKLLTTRSLFSKSEEKVISQALSSFNDSNSEKSNLLLKKIGETRKLTIQIDEVNKEFEALNILIAKQLGQLLEKGSDLSEEIKTLCNEIKDLIATSEQEHRLKQVRHNITTDILSRI